MVTSASSASLDIVSFEPSMAAAWDRFVAEAKNGTFLLLRRYMDYHADRFVDRSLLWFQGSRLVAVLPACRQGDDLVSHAGLTYGGLIIGERARTPLVVDIFRSLRTFLQRQSYERLIYKRVPYIYHRTPAEEDLYALYRAGATLSRRALSSALEPASRPRYSKGRRHGVRDAARLGIHVCASTDYRQFMPIVTALLRTRYGQPPVHTAAEIQLLATRFPENIRLFTASVDGVLEAGVIVYETPRVAHVQYSAGTDKGRRVGALDCIYDFLITDRYAGIRYFDFGASTDRHGTLNTGLLEYKESYGARAIAYETYELRPSSPCDL